MATIAILYCCALLLCFAQTIGTVDSVLSDSVTIDTNKTSETSDNDRLIVSLSDLDLTNGDLSNNRSKTISQREIIHTSKPVSKGLQDALHLFQPPDMEVLEEAIDTLPDEICREHVHLALKAMNRRERWAMKLLDSSAKFPEGMLAGSKYLLGNFDECINIRLYEKDLTVPQIQGKYCLADVIPNEHLVPPTTPSAFPRNEHNSTLYWAICVPHSCQKNEVETILEYILNKVVGNPDSVSVNLRKNMCHLQKEVPYSPIELAYGYVIVVFCSFILLATFYHVIIFYNKKDDKFPTGTLSEIVLSFSVIRNVSKMLTIGTQSNLNLNCICGIKFVSMMIIVAGHTLVFMIGGPVTNNEFFQEAIQKMENTVFLNNPLLVDTFLLISGFLVCRLVLLELEKRKGKVNFVAIYVFRYIRLTPAYLVVIGFYCTWFIRMNDGPLWDSRISEERDRCLESWWANILYINNYINADNLCMFQSWYLSVDTQLFMLAPIIVYPLWKWHKTGQTLLIVATVASIIAPFTVTFINKLDPTLMFFAPEIQDLSKNWYFINVYMKTHMRASSYCFGLAFGYIIHRIQSSDYKFSRPVLVSGWVFGTACILSSMGSVIVFYKPTYQYDAMEAAMYAAFHRSVWCLGIGWILLACITNNAGPVGRLLCWKPFVPLSRLTYCAYLVNGLVELHDSSTIRNPNHMSFYHLASNVFSHTFLTLLAAFVLCVLFESPIHGFERIILRKDKAKREEEVTSQEEA